MARRVSISLRTARVLLDYLDGAPRAIGSVAIAELRRAMAPKKSVSASRVRRVAKKATRKEARATVRLAVMERANGSCEHCRADALLSDLELDHVFGRARAESVETCWALCRYCHREKTNNRPDAKFWLEAFIEHCGTFGYANAASTARARIGFVVARSELSGRAASMTRGAQP